jgi:hypothetical protein
MCVRNPYVGEGLPPPTSGRLVCVLPLVSKGLSVCAPHGRWSKLFTPLMQLASHGCCVRGGVHLGPLLNRLHSEAAAAAGIGAVVQ